MHTDSTLGSALLSCLDHRPNAEDRAAAALHLLDWTGCALAGAYSDLGRSMACITGGSPSDHPLARGADGAAAVALRLGSFGSLLEMDDVHRAAILHPGPVVMPAVLATTTPENAERATEAALRGYEAMIRLGRAVGVGHYAQFHNTATCGGLGAAIAAAWMLELDHEQTQWAMAHALSLSAGLWECRNEPGATKHMHVAEAARRGVQAALAAQAGLAGPTRIFEGGQGFFAGLAPGGDPSVLIQGDLWALHETSFKPWPACRHAHPAIDAALALRDRLNGAVPDRIEIETYADAVLFCDKPDPKDGPAARFSLQHAVAVALTDGPPALAAFEPPALDLPAIVDLRGRTTVATDASMIKAYPAHFGARVTIHLGDKSFAETVPDAWGDTENPMDSAAVIDKFRTLGAWSGLDDAALDILQDAALDAGTGDGAAKLLQCLADLPPFSKFTPKD